MDKKELEIHIKEYEENKNNKRQLINVLNDLKEELSIRENNEHYGSRLGGNPSLLLFLITKRVEIKVGETPFVHIEKTGVNQLMISVPADSLKCDKEKYNKYYLLDIRKALANFWSDYLSKFEVSQAQISDPNWLRNLPDDQKTTEVLLLIKALEAGIILQNSLIPKLKVYRTITKLLDKEREIIYSHFLKEIDLPDNTFTTKYERNTPEYFEQCSISNILNGHPVWGEKLDAISKRGSQFEKLLLSQSDIDGVKMLDQFPRFAKTVAMRVCVGIDTIVTFELDKYMTKSNKENSKEE